MAAERSYPQEKESKIPHRLFWGGLAVAIVGAASGIGEIIAVGIIASGAGALALKRK